MELGCDAVLAATAVSRARDPEAMAPRAAARRRGGPAGEPGRADPAPAPRPGVDGRRGPARPGTRVSDRRTARIYVIAPAHAAGRAPRRPDRHARRRHRAAARPDAAARRAAGGGAGLRRGGPPGRLPVPRQRRPGAGPRLPAPTACTWARTTARVAAAREIIGGGIVGRTTRGGEALARGRRGGRRLRQRVAGVGDRDASRRGAGRARCRRRRRRAHASCRGSRSAASTSAARCGSAALGAAPDRGRARRHRGGRPGRRRGRPAGGARGAPARADGRRIRLRRRRRHPGRHQGDQPRRRLPARRGHGTDRADHDGRRTAWSGRRPRSSATRSGWWRPTSASTPSRPACSAPPEIGGGRGGRAGRPRPGGRGPGRRRPGDAGRGRLVAAGARRRRRATGRCSWPAPRSITPNLYEAQALAGLDVDDAARLAQLLHERHGCAVIVTGGHGATADDVLCDADGVTRLPGVRLAAPDDPRRGLHALLHAGRAAGPRHPAARGRRGRQGGGHRARCGTACRTARAPGPVDVCGGV